MNTLIKPPCFNGETNTPLTPFQQIIVEDVNNVYSQSPIFILGIIGDDHTAYVMNQKTQKDAIIAFCNILYSAPYTDCDGVDGTYHMSYLIETKAVHADNIIALFKKMPADFNEDTIEDVLYDRFEANIVKYSDCVAPEGSELPAIIIQTQDRAKTYLSYAAVNKENFYDCEFIFGLEPDSITKHINNSLVAQDNRLMTVLHSIVPSAGTYYVECWNACCTTTDEWLDTSKNDVKPNYMPSILLRIN